MIHVVGHVSSASVTLPESASFRTLHYRKCAVFVKVTLNLKPRITLVDRALIGGVLSGVDMSTNVVCTAHPSEHWKYATADVQLTGSNFN